MKGQAEHWSLQREAGNLAPPRLMCLLPEQAIGGLGHGFLAADV